MRREMRSGSELTGKLCKPSERFESTLSSRAASTMLDRYSFLINF
jgi:hypothetical protein